jgi:hypothetical protein
MKMVVKFGRGDEWFGCGVAQQLLICYNVAVVDDYGGVFVVFYYANHLINPMVQI